jgi:uroporphyrinogen-III decarboxylase
MNATERFVTILNGQIPDRIPILLYSMDPHKVRCNTPVMMERPEITKQTKQCADPNTQAVLEKAREVATFVVATAHSSEAALTGAKIVTSSERRPCDNPDFYRWCSTWHTPAGELSTSVWLSDKQLPPYVEEHLLKKPEDIRALLSIPFEPFDITPQWVQDQYCDTDDRCVIIWNVALSPASMIYDYAGPENFSIWSIENRELLTEAIEELARRRLLMVDAMVKVGAGPIFTTYGHEEFIPPLQSPQNFREFILPYEKQFCDRVHNHGCYVLSHSHGRVNAFLEEFAETGTDALDPLEPPPMGDVDLADAKRRIGSKVTLVGNIQTHDLMTAPTDYVRRIVKECIKTGKPDGRFFLASCAEPIVTPTITNLHRDNLLTYLKIGYEQGKY